MTGLIVICGLYVLAMGIGISVGWVARAAYEDVRSD